MRTILSVAKADFKERVRSFKYLCVLILIMILCFLFIAPKNAEYITNYMHVGKTIYRGIYNSEWIGAMIALVTFLRESSGIYRYAHSHLLR